MFGSAWNHGATLAFIGEYVRTEKDSDMEFTGIIGLIHLILVVYAAVSILGAPGTTGQKVLWILLVLLFPVVGLIIWFLAGPKKA